MRKISDFFFFIIFQVFLRKNYNQLTCTLSNPRQIMILKEKYYNVLCNNRTRNNHQATQHPVMRNYFSKAYKSHDKVVWVMNSPPLFLSSNLLVQNKYVLQKRSDQQAVNYKYLR